MNQNRVTIISIFVALFLALIAFLASYIFSSPTIQDQTPPAENAAMNQ